MTSVVLRTFIGFLVQVVPCAALCLAPFTHCFTIAPKRVYGTAATAILLAEIPFCLATIAPFWAHGRAMRFLAQDLVFITLVAVLVALWWRCVDAPAPHKLFVALLALNLGFFATIMNENVGVVLDLNGVAEYRYPVPLLVSAVIINALLLALTLPLMRVLSRMFRTLPDRHLWGRMCVLPGCFFGIMYVFHQLPLDSVPTWTLYCIQTTAIMVFAVFMFWWILGVAHEVNASTVTRERLRAALVQTEASYDALEQQLAAAQERAAELEGKLAALARAQAMSSGEADSARQGERGGSQEGSTAQAGGSAGGSADNASWAQKAVTIVGVRQAVSFLAGDLIYAESNNRARILHLVNGRTITLDTTLAQIYAELPEDHFAYCHRSVVVNLHRVTEYGAAAVIMDDGSRHPMSRRRYADFRAALNKVTPPPADPNA